MQSRIMHPENMDDTTSEATSPYSASKMDSLSMNNQSNDTYQFQSQQQMTYSPATQDRFLQGEASQQLRPACRRGKMSEDERKARKRQIDKDYRGKKKAKFDEMTSQNQHLQDQNRKLSTDNRKLEEEKELLINRNRQLEEIRGLQGKGQLPVEVLQRQDSYISHPASQVDQNVHVQDHYEMEVNNDDHVYINNLYLQYCYNGAVDEYCYNGAVDELDGVLLDELRSPPNEEMTTNGRIALNEPAIEHPESSQSDLCPAKVANIKLQKFLTKLHAEVSSNVDLSDFTGLEGEQRRFGRFSFPMSLIPTVERIKDAHGDVSETCLISPSVSGTSYVLFCAVIRDMERLRLDQVTEDIMVKWRDVIKDALRLGFSVEFAMEHLKKISCAFFGQPGRLLLHDINSKILTLEAEVNDWKKKRAEIYEESNMSIDAVENFIGVPVSTGLFP